MKANFLGYFVESNGYYNFQPEYEIMENNVLEEVSDRRLGEFIGDSEIRNINISFDLNEKNHMEKFYYDGSVHVITFDTELLEANVNKRTGVLNPTAYKIDIKLLENKEYIKYMEDYGLYYAVYVPFGDFKEYAKEILIENRYLEPSQQIIVYDQNKVYYGPYTIVERSKDKALCIRPEIKKNGYLLKSYSKEQINLFSVSGGLSIYNGTTGIVSIKNEENYELIDMIDDDMLIEMFLESVKDMVTTDNKLDISDVDALSKKYDNYMEEKEVSGNARAMRLTKIVDFLEEEKQQSDLADFISGKFSDIYVEFVNKGSENLNRFISDVVEKSSKFESIMDEKVEAEKRIAELEYRNDFYSDALSKANGRISELEDGNVSSESNKALVNRVEAMKKEIEELKSIKSLPDEEKSMEVDISNMQWHKEQLESDIKTLESKFMNKLENINELLYDTVIDGYIADKISKASLKFEADEKNGEYIKAVEILKTAENSEMSKEMTKEETLEYICEKIGKLRPGYDRNTIINLAICFTQGFITVLAGEPGSGKTSICNIFANVLGLNKLGKIVDKQNAGRLDTTLSRFIQVSVERGWTSKRDFIGYYNPLTKTFDKNNKQLYDSLKILNIECKEGLEDTPFYILLDEANLSPMEFYWADFMNLCDGVSDNSTINLGDDNIFSIPETLHFMATINNDHTTETLSPRLIDRAWVITLPKNKGYKQSEPITEEEIKIIPWDIMKKVFSKEGNEYFTRSAMTLRLEEIVRLFEDNNISVSTRSYEAIVKYCNTAAVLFSSDETRSAETIALDYAILQKLLPKISGYGEEYLFWLEELLKLCNKEKYLMSANMVENIIKKGKAKLDYFEFFC